MNAPKLSYEQVHKFRFQRNPRGHVDTTEVLHDIDLTFATGERAAVVGPSGCGKTTLLRLACRLEEPNAGIIRLDNRDIRTLDTREVRRRVGIVFQNHVLFGESVEDNVTYGLLRRGMAADEARELAGTCLEQVGLDHSFLVRKNTSLNAGQVARVVLARTIILEPEVLFVDEPTARLDPETADDLFALLREIQAENHTTILLTTPRLKEAEEFGRRIVVLLDGEVVTDVSVDEFVAGAVSAKARRYLARSGY